jgi:thioredoxin 1
LNGMPLIACQSKFNVVRLSIYDREWFPQRGGKMGEGFLDLLDDNFDKELESTDKLILIDFWNESCIPCKRMAPMLEELGRKYTGKLILTKLNTSINPRTVDRFEIKGVPTLLFMKNRRVLEKISGVRTKSELIEIIEQLL